MPKTEAPITVIVYSESPRDRDYLRCLLGDNGFNPICFANENICIDNLRSLQPKIVIARTESRDVGWRFVFALNLLKMDNPLILFSQTLSPDRYTVWPSMMPVYAVPVESHNGRLIATVKKTLRKNRNTAAVGAIAPFLGDSKDISAIRSMLPNIAASDDPVLITGEKGVGKELLSRHIALAAAPEPTLVKVDCGALPTDVSLSTWLTKIIDQERSNKPIVFLLTDVSNLCKQAQLDLLLFLDKIEAWRSSGTPGFQRHLRIIINSEASIDTQVKRGVFRKDLYYRLNVIPISIPPLRARKSDISLLMDYFIIDASIGSNKCVKVPSKKVSEMMYLHHWPGNVRELREYMERVVATDNENTILSSEYLTNPSKDKREYLFSIDGLEALPQPFEIKSFLGEHNNLALKGISRKFVTRTEKRFLKKALELTNWNRKRAAKMLNISYKSMLNKMKAYDII